MKLSHNVRIFPTSFKLCSPSGFLILNIKVFSVHTFISIHHKDYNLFVSLQYTFKCWHIKDQSLTVCHLCKNHQRLSVSPRINLTIKSYIFSRILEDNAVFRPTSTAFPLWGPNASGEFIQGCAYGTLPSATQPRCGRPIKLLLQYLMWTCTCIYLEGQLFVCIHVYEVYLGRAQNKHKHSTRRALDFIQHLKSLEGNVISLGGFLAANQGLFISLSTLIW